MEIKIERRMMETQREWGLKFEKLVDKNRDREQDRVGKCQNVYSRESQNRNSRDKYKNMYKYQKNNNKELKRDTSNSNLNKFLKNNTHLQK